MGAGPVKPKLAAVAFVIPLALLGLALGVRTAVRERTLPGRELAAIEAARERAASIAARPCPELDALAARAHEDVLPPDALALEGLEEWGVLSLDPKERPVVWERTPRSPHLALIADAIRGGPVTGELASQRLAAPGESFSAVWSLGVADGEARVAVALGRRRGLRAVVAVCVYGARVP